MGKEYMLTFINEIIEIMRDPAKSLITTFSGTTLGYAPDVINKELPYMMMDSTNTFQYIVWTLTCLVAVGSIVNFIQKQIDRKRESKKPLTKKRVKK